MAMLPSRLDAYDIPLPAVLSPPVRTIGNGRRRLQTKPSMRPSNPAESPPADDAAAAAADTAAADNDRDPRPWLRFGFGVWTDSSGRFVS
jgi:hypothetical protein